MTAFTSPASAGFDLGLFSSYRDFPLSGVAEVNFGYGQLLWGSEKNALYGFVRASGELDAVSNYFGATAKVEVFPVSILGLKAGQTWEQNHQDYKDYDCTQNICRGFFSNQYLEGQAFLGVSFLKLAASYRDSIHYADHYSNPNSVTDYVDPESGLLLTLASGDHLIRVRETALVQILSNYAVGYSESQFSSQIRAEKSRAWFSFAQGTWGDFKLAVGGGEYSSSTQKSHGMIVAFMQWSILPKLGY